MGQKWLDGYSADVEIYVLHEGKRYDVAQIGNGSLIMRGHPNPIPAGSRVTLVIIIDGHQTEEKVSLMESSDRREPVPFF